MCHNHDYHPCEREKMNKELPKPITPGLDETIGGKLPLHWKAVEALNARLALVEERVERCLALVSIAPGWEKEARERLSALEFLHGKLDPTFLHKHDETDHYCAPALHPYKRAGIDSDICECGAPMMSDVHKHPAPPTEGEAKENCGHRCPECGALAYSPYNTKEYKRLNDDYCHLLLEKDAAERRLQDAVDEAREWFNKENGYLLGAMAELKFNVWLARYGDKGGEKP